jgi:hypothetical protein
MSLLLALTGGASVSGWEPAQPQTKSPRGKLGTSFDGPLPAWLYPVGPEPLGPVTVSPRGHAGSNWDGPFVPFLMSSGFEPPPPVTISPRGRIGASWDGPSLAFLAPSGWEPPGPQTISPRGRGAINWDGPLVPFLSPGGWEPNAPIVRQLRSLFPDAPPPLLASLLLSGWEPPGPRTASPQGKGAVNYDGSGLLAALAEGGWYPMAPAPSSPRGKQGVNYDPAGLLAALGLSGWEPPSPLTISPQGKPGPNFDGSGLLAALGPGGWYPIAPTPATAPGKTGSNFDGPLLAILLPTGWEPAQPRNRWIPPGWGDFAANYSSLLLPLLPPGEFLYGPPTIVLVGPLILTPQLGGSLLSPAVGNSSTAVILSPLPPMGCRADFFITQNDLSPSIKATLLDLDGKTPKDLTGATISFRMQLASKGGVVILGACSIIGSPTLGVVQYDWVSGDTANAGNFIAEWIVTLPGGKTMTWPNDSYKTVQIKARLVTGP